MTKLYKDIYGSSASIGIAKNGEAHLIIYDSHGIMFVDKWYTSERGARIALGKYGDCWHNELTGRG